jgi:diguanylate cyclase (GGDEF)-like protein
MWGRPETAAAAALGVLTVLVVSGAGGERTTVAVADLSAAVAALVAAWATGRRARSDRSGPWWGLTLAVLLWATGELLWSWFEVVLGDEVPFPSVADVAYLGAVPFAAWSLLAFTRGGRRTHFHARAVLDGAVIAGSLLFVGWALALGPTFRAGAEDAFTHAVSVAYPVTDVVMAVLALLVLQWGATGERRSLRLVASAFVLMAVADTWFTWLTTNGSYTSSNPVTMLWPASYLLLALAARQPVHDDPVADQRTQTTTSLLLPYVPLAAALLVAAPRVLGGRSLGPFLTATGSVLVVSVLVRQALTAWELRDVVLSLHEREAQLARLALEDPLTGLANRARFAERLERLALGGHVRPAVVYIDLDGFKAVNDRHGHAVGDQLLVEVGVRLRACCTSEMLLARLGGDEFVVLVERGHDDAVALAERVLASFSVPFHHDGEAIAFQASVGIATAPADAGPEEAVRRADAAMYVAKTSGKGRAVGYPDEPVRVAPATTA